MVTNSLPFFQVVAISSNPKAKWLDPFTEKEVTGITGKGEVLATNIWDKEDAKTKGETLAKKLKVHTVVMQCRQVMEFSGEEADFDFG